MSEYLICCPKCSSSKVETKVVYDPKTSAMNCKATLKCSGCEYEWEGEVTSPWYEHQQQMGFIR